MGKRLCYLYEKYRRVIGCMQIFQISYYSVSVSLVGIGSQMSVCSEFPRAPARSVVTCPELRGQELDLDARNCDHSRPDCAGHWEQGDSDIGQEI